jgi:hypothetical protein
VAFLQFSLSNALDWLLDKNVVSEEKAKELIKEGWKTFNELVDENQKRIHNEDPVTKFMDILRSLIVQKKVRIEPREYSIRAPLSLGGEEGKADLIGFYDDSFFYLLPTPLWNAVQRYCGSSNDFFPVSKNTLYRTLEKKRLIESREGKHTIPLKHNGQVHKILKISRQDVWEKEVTCAEIYI